MEAVRSQLESLSGTRRAVPRALWCELLRTRTEEETKKSLLMQLQNASGCRIHIERGHPEVRIFGTNQASAMAEELLDEAATRCTQGIVPFEDGAPAISPSILEYIATTCEVTLEMQEHGFVASGLHHAVAAAVEELKHELIMLNHVDTDDEFDFYPQMRSSSGSSSDSWSVGGCRDDISAAESAVASWPLTKPISAGMLPVVPTHASEHLQEVDQGSCTPRRLTASWPVSQKLFTVTQGQPVDALSDVSAGTPMTMTPSTTSTASSSFATEPLPKQLVQPTQLGSLTKEHGRWGPLATGQPLLQPVLFSVQVR